MTKEETLLEGDEAYGVTLTCPRRAPTAGDGWCWEVNTDDSRGPVGGVAFTKWGAHHAVRRTLRRMAKVGRDGDAWTEEIDP